MENFSVLLCAATVLMLFCWPSRCINTATHAQSVTVQSSISAHKFVSTEFKTG